MHREVRSVPATGLTVPGRRNARGRNYLSCGAARVGPHIEIAAVAFQVTVETGAVDAENLGSAKATAVAHLEHLLDVYLANLVERERVPVLVSGEGGRGAEDAREDR